MKLRRIDCPADFRWLGPVMTPADLHAVASARQIIDQARARAAEIEQTAQASVKALQLEVREAFLSEYGAAFRQAIDVWQQERLQLQQNISAYAREMAVATLNRLGSGLALQDRLDAVLRLVLSEIVPDTEWQLLVAPESVKYVHLRFLGQLQTPVLPTQVESAGAESADESAGEESSAHAPTDHLSTAYTPFPQIAGMSLRIEADKTLSGDEVILAGPKGARIRCSFQQLTQQLLLCL